MEKITIDNKDYQIVGGTIQKDDLFLYNNPNTERKNVLRTCSFIHEDGSIQPKNQFLVITQIPAKWCTKVVLLKKEEL
jgi:hypothetical protein